MDDLVASSTLLGDRFELQREVARGGMGAVYRAQDRQTKEAVAVKLMTAERPEAAERFEREATLLATLHHPAIVRYVAHGVSDKGRPWLAMQWLDGTPLSARLKTGPLSLPECVSVTRRVASALETAHAAGVVHRDVKPSNLFLVNDDPAQVAVLDFGIARHASGMDEVTATGEVVGTWAYMSPEQAMAQGTLDARTDLFSLGCVSFECLTGRKAFHARQQTGILAKILLEDPPAPSSINSIVPAALDDLVLRLLSKSPAARPQSAAALLTEITALGDPAQLPVRPRSVPPTGITTQEQRLLSVVLARGLREPDATIAAHDTNDPTRSLYAIAEMHGARLHFLANGVLVVTISGRGAPTDHAARAARAALALHALEPRAMLALSTGFGVIGDVMPVGAVIDRGVDTLRGAGPGEIHVDATTRDLVTSGYEIKQRGGSHLLEGSADGRGIERSVLGRTVPFVGRRQELATLCGLVQDVAEESNSRALLLSGPAGSGKSRLLREALSSLDAPPASAKIWFARCDPVGAGTALSLVRWLLEDGMGLVGRTGDVRKALLERQLQRLLGSLSHREETSAMLGHLLAAEEADHPLVRAAQRESRLMADAQRQAVCELLTAECQERPLVLELEDLHWCDSASIAALDSALRQLGSLPLTVIATARPEVHEEFPGLWQHRNALELRLAPLSNKSAQRIIRSVLGAGVAPETVANIVTRAQGNAFYLEELLRATAAGSKRLPDTVVGMVQSRLDGLGTDHKRLLRAASIFGERFELGAAQALLGVDAVRLPVDSIIADLLEREILSQEDKQLRFRHGLVRDAAYAMLTDKDRTLGHRLAAEWLRDRPEPDAFAIAEHFRRGSKADQAAPLYLAAAKHALAAGAHERVLEHVACAQEGELAPELQGALFAVCAEAQRYLADPKQALASARSALSMLEPAREDYFHAMRECVLAATQLGDYTAALRAAKLLSATEVLPPTCSLRAITLLRVAAALLEGVSGTEIDTWLSPHLDEVARQAPDELQVRAWLCVYRSLRAHVDGDLEGYVHETEQAEIAMRKLGDARSACVFGMNLGYGMARIGELSRAVEVLLEAERRSRRLGLVRTEVQATTNLSYALLCAGNLPAAATAASRAIAAAQEIDASALECVARAYASLIQLNMGDTDMSLEHARLAVELATTQPGLMPMCQAAKSRALLAQGQKQAALETALAATALADASSSAIEEAGWCALALAEAQLATGQDAEARRTASAAKDVLQKQAAQLSSEPHVTAFLALPTIKETLALAGTLSLEP